jgi:tRNA1(Val) A37 N6-methylase TrmN6
MPADGLHRWVAFLATAARADATLTLIHRADALATILAALEGRFGRIRVLPIHPRSGAPAGLVLISARKGSRAPLEIQSGLALQGADGRYRTEVEAILREGAALDMTGSRYVIA